jgi:Na+/H+-translocating membrane pyrophosphatase
MVKDEGTAEMRAVSTPIREGAEGFMRVQVRKTRRRDDGD